MTAITKPSPRRKLTHAQIEAVRHQRSRSMLLFITDRCPVNCDHCSVDSRPDSPTIRDFVLFDQILDWLGARIGIEIIGISGGEPFVERKGLRMATERLRAAGKQLVVFTSGVWAQTSAVPVWIEEVLRECACIYLSTDAFHATGVGDEQFVRAARTIVRAGSSLVVQVVAYGDGEARARSLLARALGNDWQSQAELNLVQPLNNGRGQGMFARIAWSRGESFGPCALARSPMLRYDGVVTGCCNEGVIMGQGPKRLRQHCSDASAIDAAVEGFAADPLLHAIGTAGLGVVVQHPKLKALARERFSSNCELCWKVFERMPDRSEPDRMMTLIDRLVPDPGPVELTT